MPITNFKPRLRATLAAASLIVLASLCAGTAGAAIPAGNTGWTWSNPLPQGNALDRIEASGGRIWAGGATGTLMHSDDGGGSWQAARTGLLDDIRTVDVISPNSIVFAGSCALRRSDDGGATIRRLAWGSSDDSCPAQIQALSFPSPLIGYMLLTNGDVYTTGDGGDSWTKQGKAPGTPTTGGTDAARDIAFSGVNTGVLSAGTHIYQSVDAGVSWTPVKTAASGAGLFNFEFLSSNVGYAVGDHTDVLKTIDGGTTWNAVAGDGSPHGFDVRSMSCASETSCLATVAGADYVLRTTDGGASWSIATPIAGSAVNGVVFASATRAVAVGANGITAVSDDAGATWSPVNAVAGGKFRSLRTDSASNALIFGDQGAIARSTDGGASWTSIFGPSTGQVVDATFATATRGYAIDDSGRFFRTDNAGNAWKRILTGAAKPRAVFVWKSSTVVLVGSRGVRISRKGGASSKPAKGPVSRLTLRSIDAAGKALFVYGPRAIAVTADKGAKWHSVRRPAGSAPIVRLDMTDAKYGFLLDGNNELFATKTGGKTWARVETTGANLAVSMAFGDRKHGYLTDNTGRVLATADAGKTWSRQYPFYDANAASFSAVSAPSKLSALTLVEGTNRVFRTDTGGRIGTPSVLTIKPSAPRARSGAIVRVTGKLTPATGSERVAVLARITNAKGGTRWVSQERTVSATGTFTTAWKITASTEFIARWSGDAAHDGDAAPLVVVKLRK